MNIGAVKGGAYVAATGQSNPQLQAIDKQISELNKNIREVKADKNMDEKTKSEKVKGYQEQIAQLQQQKAQIQAESRKIQQESRQSDESLSREQEQEQDMQVKTSTQQSLIEMDTAVKTGRQLGPVRADLEGKLRIAESKSYLASPDPEAAATYRNKINNINSTIMGKLEKAADRLQRAAEAEASYNAKAVSASSGETGKPDEVDATEEEKRRGTGRMEPGQFLYDEA